MKITNNTKQKKEFYEIFIGDCFLSHDDIFLKICEDKAFDLQNLCIQNFNLTEEVVPCLSELIIN